MLQKLRDCFLFVLICFLLVSLWELRQWTQEQAPAIQATLSHIEATTAQAEGIATDSRPILTMTLLHADRAVGEAAMAMANVAQTSRQIRDDQRTIAAATLVTLGETAATVKSVNQQVETIGEQARYTLSGLESTSKAATRTLDDLDKVVQDPNLNRTFFNASRITESWALMSDDGQKKFHSILYPEPYTGRFQKLHTFWTYSSPLLRLSEPLYYITNIHKK